MALRYRPTSKPLRKFPRLEDPHRAAYNMYCNACQQKRETAVPSVIVILPPAIGDVMMAVPLLRELSAAGWSVGAVVDTSLSPLAEVYPPSTNSTQCP